MRKLVGDNYNMRLTLEIDNELHHRVEVAAMNDGSTISDFIREAIEKNLSSLEPREDKRHFPEIRIARRNRLMDDLLRRTSHFPVGKRPSREEPNN
jgi:metal-responsive CopG/Arc/MetJ family transcriptional regulator